MEERYLKSDSPH